MTTNTKIASLVAAGISISGTQAAPKIDLCAALSERLPFYRADCGIGRSSISNIVISEASSLSIADLIDVVCADQDSYEVGEAHSTPKAIGDLKQLIIEASAVPEAAVTIGDIAPYFGELSITWRQGNRMLRATSFSDDRSPRLDFGTTPAGSLGAYEFDTNATGTTLAAKLSWLYGQTTTTRP